MHRTGIVLLWLLCVCACGSSSAAQKNATSAESAPRQSADSSQATQSPSTTNKAAPPAPVEPPPIDILNGRLHAGFVVGGLPTRAQIDEAWDSNFDSAMSLMSNDEPGCVDIGRYAASKGIRYIRLVVRGPDEITESMAWQFASTLSMLDKPAIIHSAKGERVGALFALKAFFVDEASAEEALAIGEAAGMGQLAPRVRKLLRK